MRPEPDAENPPRRSEAKRHQFAESGIGKGGHVHSPRSIARRWRPRYGPGQGNWAVGVESAPAGGNRAVFPRSRPRSSQVAVDNQFSVRPRPSGYERFGRSPQPYTVAARSHLPCGLTPVRTGDGRSESELDAPDSMPPARGGWDVDMPGLPSFWHRPG